MTEPVKEIALGKAKAKEPNNIANLPQPEEEAATINNTFETLKKSVEQKNPWDLSFTSLKINKESKQSIETKHVMAENPVVAGPSVTITQTRGSNFWKITHIDNQRVSMLPEL
ncbi:9011_t:CDS:2 [Dentiscutata heterogama]|uniref:9011_t:CDS:1 n=1 Tax=Dentiscutata heterogama TaxID=1316150 RepID=A0ACA9K5B4_9GLOM|nr:9011_t:CDS:2 [Dentiscutata heterogama]